jgi:hypothetical protein
MIIMIYGCVIWRGCESSSGCAGDLSPSRHNIVSVVSSRGATLVLATPTQRQIWRRIIFTWTLCQVRDYEWSKARTLLPIINITLTLR